MLGYLGWATWVGLPRRWDTAIMARRDPAPPASSGSGSEPPPPGVRGTASSTAAATHGSLRGLAPGAPEPGDADVVHGVFSWAGAAIGR